MRTEQPPPRDSDHGGRIAFVLKGYPRLSETFISQEILALEQRDIPIDLYSLRHPTDKSVHPIHSRITAQCQYLPEYLYQEPRRVTRAWRVVRHWPTYRHAFEQWLRDLRRDRTPNRVRRFGQALVLATELRPGTALVHAHFLHTPASVARYTSMLTSIPWTVSAHAKDIWTSPSWEKAEKLDDCNWAVTCTAGNAEHLASLAPADRVHLVYHGLDARVYPISRGQYSSRCGTVDEVVILSVGRAVAKKGYDDLLVALSVLPQSLRWRFVHIGGGPLTDRLRERASALGLSQRIEWRGAAAQPDVLRAYRQADLFVLASKVADDGDRDGLPNVLMEAQSQGLACVATAVSAIPELILDEETGLLAAPGTPSALARQLERLIVSPSERARLGRAGQARMANEFSLDDGADWLAVRFRQALASPELSR